MATLKNYTQGLTGAKRDAVSSLIALFTAYGLGSLAPKIVQYVQQGYSADTVSIMLQDTSEFRQRFSGNVARQKAGLPVLSPAEYLATENSYRQIMSAAGLPPGFYDQPSDFTKWISQDVSPQEIQTRVSSAQKLVQSADPTLRAQFSQWYTQGDLVAYALDRKRAADVVARQVQAAGIGAAAQSQHVTALDRQEAERLAELGVNQAQAQQGFGQVADLGQRGGQLGSLYGVDYNQQDALNEVFFSDAAATTKRERLAAQEQATFSGTSGVNSNTLSTRKAGQV